MLTPHMAKWSAVDIAPDDVVYEVLTFLSFNDVMKTWRLVNKECNYNVQLYYTNTPLKSFDADNGHWRLLPTIETKTVFEYKAPDMSDNPYKPNGARKSFYEWHPVERIEMVEGDRSLDWLSFFFSHLSRIDLSGKAMAKNITDMGIFHLGCLTEKSETKLLHLNISDCSKLSDPTLRYLKIFLDQGLEELVARNISYRVLLPLPCLPSLATQLTTINSCLKILDLSENHWLTWAEVVCFLRATPQLERLNLSRTNVGAGERIDFFDLECRHTLREINFSGVVGFLGENDENILLACPQVQKKISVLTATS